MLIEACLNADNRAQYELYNRFNTKMMGVCLRYAKSREEAQDMLQDGFIKVYRDLHQYKPTSPLGAWIRRVMINTALEHVRKRKYHINKEVDIQNLSDKYESNDNVFSQFRQKALVNMIQLLPTDYQLVFNLYAIEGYAHKEIAEMLNISVSASKVRLSRARVALQKLLEKHITT